MRVKGALLALFLFLPFMAAAGAPVHFDTAPLAIVSADGKTHRFIVELAVTDEQRSLGLMYRQVLPDDRGMLFDFTAARRVAMWMKNTVVPLDMLFIDDGGTIRQIHPNAVPFSQAVIASGSEVRYVLEIAGGRAAVLGLREGDRVVSDRIGKVN